jgi:large-conductance mechanosensitive channel
VIDQPIILGAVYLAGNFQAFNKYIKILLCGGLFIDSLWGVLLHFWIQHYTLDDLIAINKDGFILGQNVALNVLYNAQSGYAFIADLNYSAFITAVLATLLTAWIIYLIWSRRAKLETTDGEE